MLYRKYRDKVEATASKWFSDTGKFVAPKKPYILARHEDWEQNLIDPRIYALVEKVRPRHTYVHHGLSSQVLCFNLFGALLLRKSLDSLKDIVVSKGGSWPEGPCDGEFEFDEPAVFNENSREQPTSWDFAIRAPGQYPFALVEVKFVEQSVGACSVFERGDCDGLNPVEDFQLCFLEKEKKRQYWEVFKAQGILDTPAFAGTICPMTIYYQFYREATFAAAKRVQMIFLYDDRNPVFGRIDNSDQRGLLPLLMRHLPPAVAKNIKIITLSELAYSLHASGRHDDWLPDFARKYGISLDEPSYK